MWRGGFHCPGHQWTAQTVSKKERDYSLILIEVGLSSSLLPISLRASEGNYMSALAKTACRFTKDSTSTGWRDGVFGGIRMKQPGLSLLRDISTIWGIYAWVVGMVPWQAPRSDTLDCRWLTHLTVPPPKNTLPLSAVLLFLVSLHFIHLPASFERITKKMRWEIINKISARECINNMSVCVCALIVCVVTSTWFVWLLFRT